MRRFSLLVGQTALTWLTIGSHVHAEERPFRMEGRGFVNPFGFSGNGNDPYMTGHGEALHLGRCVWLAPLDALALQESWDVVPLAVRFGASDGDFLNAEIETDYDAETGLLIGTITFTGGTGRFADASGSASLLIAFDTVVTPFDYSRFAFAIDGTINY